MQDDDLRTSIRRLSQRVDLLFRRQKRSETCLKQIKGDTHVLRLVFTEIVGAIDLIKRIGRAITFILKYIVLPVSAIFVLGYFWGGGTFPEWWAHLRGLAR